MKPPAAPPGGPPNAPPRGGGPPNVETGCLAGPGGPPMPPKPCAPGGPPMLGGPPRPPKPCTGWLNLVAAAGVPPSLSETSSMVKGWMPPGEGSSMREVVIDEPPIPMPAAEEIGVSCPMGTKASTRGGGTGEASLKLPKPVRGSAWPPPVPRAAFWATKGEGEASLEKDMDRIMLSPPCRGMLSTGGGGSGGGCWISATGGTLGDARCIPLKLRSAGCSEPVSEALYMLSTVVASGEREAANKVCVGGPDRPDDVTCVCGDDPGGEKGCNSVAPCGKGEGFCTCGDGCASDVTCEDSGGEKGCNSDPDCGKGEGCCTCGEG